MPYDFDRPLMYKEFVDASTAEERERLFYSYLSAVDAHFTGATRTRRLITVSLTYKAALDAVSYLEVLLDEN